MTLKDMIEGQGDEAGDLTLGGTRAGTGNEVFGIDLGTTYSAIAWLDQNGKPETICNIEGSPTTPSVVYFESDENITVGETAKEMTAQEPNKVVAFIKREMGNASYSFIGPGGRQYSPIEISGFILKKLAKDAETKTGCPVKKVIITCPAYFGTDEHKATKAAGEYAGLEVVQVLNEPTAAAYAYGVKCDEPQTVLVYDLGGGTFDVTIMRVTPSSIETVVTDGDRVLGGKNWDAAFVDLLARKWRDASGEDKDILADPAFKGELMILAERNKKFLSTKTSVRIRVAPPDGEGVSVEVTREEFESATAGLLEQTIQKTKDALEKAAKKEGVEKFVFDTLLCVGGSSIMPQVAARLEREFGMTPRLEDPHECVAKGAAVFAGIPHVGGGDVLSKSYGLVAGRRNPDGSVREIVYNLLLCNQSREGARYAHVFKTEADNMRTIKFRVTESDLGCWENTKAADESLDRADTQEREFPMDEDLVPIIQTSEMILPPNLRAGESVEVTFAVDADMVLNVTAVLLSTGEKVEIRCEGVGVKVPEKKMPDGIVVD